MTSAALLDLAARVATNTLTVLQQNALSQALLAIAPTFPSPDEESNAIAPPDEGNAREWIAALYAIQSLSGGVAPLPPTLLVTTPNLAGLAALSTVSLADGSEAFVQTVGAYFTLESTSTLAVDGITVIAAAGGGRWLRTLSGIQEIAIAQTAWFVDRVAGNDENTGLTNVTALKTKAEIVRRWGTNAPTLTVLVTITYLTADIDGSDPGLFFPTFVLGGGLLHTAPLPAPAFTGTLLAVTAKNSATNQALQSTFTPTTGAIALRMLLVNTTRGNSRAFAQRNTAGGTWQLTQPMVPFVFGGFPTAEVNTWANGDAILGYILPNVCLSRIGGTQAEFGLAFGPTHVVQQLAIFSANGFGAFYCDLSAYFCLVDMIVPAGTNLSVAGTPVQQAACTAQGCFINQVRTNGTELIFNVAAGTIGTSSRLRSSVLTLDVIVTGTVDLFDATQFSGPIFVDTGATLKAHGDTNFLAVAAVYGPGIYNQGSGTTNYTGTAATVLPIATLQLNGVATGYSNLTAVGLTAVHKLALTAANLDAAAGAAGFGGLAYAGACAFSAAGIQP
jgi:hypothetical protein